MKKRFSHSDHHENSIGSPLPIVDYSQEHQTQVARIYIQLKEDLHRYISKLLRSQEDVDEVLQDVFVRLLKHPPDQEKQEKVRAYVFVIAANLVKDKLRKHVTHHQKNHTSVDDVDLHANAANPEGYAVSEQLHDRLLRGLQKLEYNYSQVFIMSRFMHLSHIQIAEKLDVSVRTVERRMRYAIDFFRSNLEEYL